MSNSGFNLPNGLAAGPLTIDATTSAITTSGNIVATGWSGTNAPGGAPAPSGSTDVKLLLNMNGADGATTTTDSSLSPKAITLGGSAVLSTTQSKFGGSSVYLDDAGWVSAADSDLDIATGTGDFTIEFWFYQTVAPTSTNAGSTTLFGQAILFNLYEATPTGSAGAGSGLGIATRINDMYFGDFRTWGSTGWAYSNNTWNHMAVTRSGGTLTAYFNGTQVAQTTNTVLGTAVNKLVLGRWWNGDYNRQFNGYIDDVRIVKGQVLYTGTFTPPAAQLTTTI